MLPDLMDDDAPVEPFPAREREFVNLSPDVPVPGRVRMIPAGRMEAGICPACRTAFHVGDTIAVSDAADYVPDLPKFHAWCWKRAADERTHSVAKMAEVQFGGGLS